MPRWGSVDLSPGAFQVWVLLLASVLQVYRPSVEVLLVGDNRVLMEN